MVADLRRCVGCQTCTAACKHANATPPGVQWRRVLDMEFGEYPRRAARLRAGGLPALRRSAVHGRLPDHGDAASAPTASSPSTTTCASAAPTAPWPAPTRRATRPSAPASPTAQPTREREPARTTTRASRWPPSAPSASTASTAGWRTGLTPGVDPEATPACVNSCIAQALALRRPRRSAEQRVATAGRRTSISACTRSWAPARASTTCGTRWRRP